MAHGTVIAAKDNLVTIESAFPIMRNEVAYVQVGSARLKAEVLNIRGNTAQLQVYENTQGVTVGCRVELTRELLSVALGPGLLGSIYDGLQNPLAVLAHEGGFFLQRGHYADPLDRTRKWAFEPLVRAGQSVRPGQVLGQVQEGRWAHRIMAPFNAQERLTVEWIEKGTFTIEQPVACLKTATGESLLQTLVQRQAVRRPLTENLLRHGHVQRRFPQIPLVTSIRIVDSFFPIAQGGTGCIPGPFGAGKTVLQNLIARYSNVDIVIIIACGERAGEVVETITEFPRLKDPNSGGSLMDRTVIVANTSSMPVTARESSIYTGITIGEYYRQMGYNVLVIADSTSRWAQALREMSGRMEEIPGEEAFPAYLDSAIKRFYERAGVYANADGQQGSLSIVGTVSPAGGNFDEPVTQATLSTVKTFLGLSAELAYRRCFPAIDHLISWSRYHTQLEPWYAQHLGATWVADIQRQRRLLVQGEAVYQMMQVTGEEGISLADYIVWHKAGLLATVFLQQDAFDAVDAATPLARQKELFYFLCTATDQPCTLSSKEAVRDYFTGLTALFKALNYAATGSERFTQLQNQIETYMADPKKKLNTVD